jgi:hypothetical protein
MGQTVISITVVRFRPYDINDKPVILNGIDNTVLITEPDRIISLEFTNEGFAGIGIDRDLVPENIHKLLFQLRRELADIFLGLA